MKTLAAPDGGNHRRRTVLPLFVVIVTALLPSCSVEAAAVRAQRYDLQQGMTVRCEELCSEAHEMGKFTADLRTDCQRGCQYFNRRFLVTATDENIVTDLATILEHSQQSTSRTANKSFLFD